MAGPYGAIFVGLFAALFGGTPAQVSGPAEPMTVMMAGMIGEDHRFGTRVVALGHAVHDVEDDVTV